MDELSAEEKLKRITKIWQDWFDSDDCSGVTALAEIGGLLDVSTGDEFVAREAGAGG